MLDLAKFNNAGFSRGASRGKELLWWLARSLLFAPWFPLPSAPKVAVLRLFGAKVGNGVVIRSRVNITFPWKLEVGDHVWLGDEVLILSLDRVTIGSNVCISQRAFLCTGSHDFNKETFDLITQPIDIGDGCWIAAQAFVGPGVVMPAGTMVKAGEVVKKTQDNKTQDARRKKRELTRGAASLSVGALVTTRGMHGSASPALSVGALVTTRGAASLSVGALVTTRRVHGRAARMGKLGPAGPLVPTGSRR